MTRIFTSYSMNKTGTYLEFKMPVNATELDTIEQYGQMLKETIERDFKTLVKKHNLEFSSESPFIVHENDRTFLVICLLGKTDDSLTADLDARGFPKEDVV